MLKERGYFLLKRENGDVELNFRTWTFQRFCEISGNLSYQQMMDLLTQGIGIKQMADLLLCAAEYRYVKDKKACPYDNMDACEWIDELGGINGGPFLEVITVATSALIDQGAKVSEEKKIESH